MHHNPDVKAAFDHIVARTPAVGPAPSPARRPAARHRVQGRRAVVAVAASVIVLGVAALTWVATAPDGPSRPASAPPTPTVPTPATEPAESAPVVMVTPALSGTTTSSPVPLPLDPPAGSTPRGGPTQFPILDPAVVGGAQITARLDYYNGAILEPQTNAVVARIDATASATDLYTLVAGPGAGRYIHDMGLSADASTPRVTDIFGVGVAAWTIDGVQVVMAAPDPGLLLDDPAFSMTVGSDDNGNATLDFESLPPGFELLVPPQRSAREAASATMWIGSPSDSTAFVGTVSASLDNPLLNTNLTEGSTISPSQVGGQDAWIVSFPGIDQRTVVWSPDGTTWVAVNWTGPEDDLVALAGAVTFTTDVGEWMTRYGVDLPPIHFDGVSASG